MIFIFKGAGFLQNYHLNFLDTLLLHEMSDTRSRIEKRDHRSNEDLKPIKAFYLDLVLDAQKNGETDRLKALTTDLFRNKFDQITKYELNSVDPPFLKKFLELLNEEKREEFMNLAKPKST